jgi:hypothetical protein
MLEHHTNAEASSLRRMVHGDLFALPKNRARVGSQDAIDDFDKRTLAGAVFAKQRMNRSFRPSNRHGHWQDSPEIAW